MPSSTTTGHVVAAKSPSTPPDYSRRRARRARPARRQLGTHAGVAGRHPHIAHGTTSSLNALVTGNVADRRLPHHQGPPRLDLHHERRGPLSRPLGRTSCRTCCSQTSPTVCCPSGTRWRSPSGSTATARSSSPSTRTTRARRSGRCSTTASSDRDLAAVVVPQPGPRAAAARARRRESTRTCSSRCPARSARGSGSSPATPRRS